jgi:hypothetical protein
VLHDSQMLFCMTVLVDPSIYQSIVVAHNKALRRRKPHRLCRTRPAQRAAAMTFPYAF